MENTSYIIKFFQIVNPVTEALEETMQNKYPNTIKTLCFPF